MQLTDFLFLFAFLPAALICAALTGNRPHARNALLLAMSVLFCAASGLPGLLAAAIEILAAEERLSARANQNAENASLPWASCLPQGFFAISNIRISSCRRCACRRFQFFRLRWACRF